MGYNNLNLAIDSIPLSKDIYSSFDYSGLQVYSLTSLALKNFLTSDQFLQKIDNNVEVKIPNNIYWSDGSPITPQHYLNGIKKVILSNPFIKKFLFRNVKAISANKTSIVFELSKANQCFFDILSIPNFSPFMDGESLSSGKYIIEDFNNSEIKLIKNPYYYEDPLIDKIKISLIKEPAQNYQLFKESKLDITADTAFDFNNFSCDSEDIHKSNTGLYCVIKMGSSLSGISMLDHRLKLKEIIKKINFDGLTLGHYPQIDNFKMLSNNFKSNNKFSGHNETIPNISKDPKFNRPIMLHYDNYYPNHLICNLIAKKLMEQGIEVVLVEDNYENPSSNYDLRFSIIRGLSNSDYLIYCSFLFSGPLVANKEKQRKYLEIVNDIETNQVKISFGINKLQSIIDDEAAIIPLFYIPSIFYSKIKNMNNPLTEVFQMEKSQSL